MIQKHQGHHHTNKTRHTSKLEKTRKDGVHNYRSHFFQTISNRTPNIFPHNIFFLQRNYLQREDLYDQRLSTLHKPTRFSYSRIQGRIMSRVNVYLTFRMLLYFRISNSVMLSSDNRNILIIGFSFQGTVLNVFFSVFNVIRYNSNGIL